MKTTYHILLALSLLLPVAASAHAADSPDEWRVGPAAWTFRKFTFFEAVDKTASLGLSCIEAFQGQQVRPDSEAKLDVGLPDEDVQRIHDKLKSANVTLTSIYIHRIPGEEAACRKTFEFARKLGVEFIVSEPEPEAFDVIEACCDEYDISVAIHNHPEGKSRYWDPKIARQACEGRSARIGVCADTGHWLRSGLNPADGIRVVGDRLISVHLKDLTKAAPDGVDRPWGQGCGEMEQVLRTVQELGLSPKLFAVEYESAWDNNMPQVGVCSEWFKKTTAKLAKEAKEETR